MNDSASHPFENRHPQLGIDARLSRAFNDDPLVRAIREETKAIVLATEVRKHPELHPDDPRAATILAQLSTDAAFPAPRSFGAGGHRHEYESGHLSETEHF